MSEENLSVTNDESSELFGRSASDGSKIPFTLFLLGNCEHNEFSEIRTALFQASSQNKLQIRFFPHLSDLLDKQSQYQSADSPSLFLEKDFLPDLFFFLESYPGEFVRKNVMQLRRIFPICPFIFWVGSWGEGEERTGETPLGIVRYYVHHWERASRNEWTDFLNGNCPQWFAPQAMRSEDRTQFLTSEFSSDNRFSSEKMTEKGDCPDDFNSKQGHFLKNGRKKFLILAEESAMGELLVEYVQKKGGKAVFIVPEHLPSLLKNQAEQNDFSEPDTLLWDTFNLSDPELLERLSFLRSFWKNTELVLLAFSPRPDEYQTLSVFAPIRIVSKPFFLDDL